MSGRQVEGELAPSASTWRPFGVVLAVLALMALFVVPATLETPAEAQPVAIPDVPAPPQPAPSPSPNPAPVDPSAPAVAPPGGDVPGLPDIIAPTPTAPPGIDDGNGTPSPGEQEGSQDPEDDLLYQLARAIPVPPELQVPEIPEAAQPFTDSVAPALFLFCSIAALPGGMGGVVAGLAGDAIPGFGDLLGALLLYQVPILDLCLIFGFPEEVVECTIDEAILAEFPQAVPISPPAPLGSMLGIIRGVEGSLAGDTIGTDVFLESIGCSARPS